MIFTPFLSIFSQEPRTHGSESRPSQRPRRSYPFWVPTAAPCALAAPAPHPRSVRRAAAARAFPLGRLPRCAPAAARARARSPAPAGVLASGPPSPQQHRLAAAGSAGCARCAQPLLRYSGSAGKLQGLRPPLLPPRYAVGVCYRRQRLLLCPFRACGRSRHITCRYAQPGHGCCAYAA